MALQVVYYSFPFVSRPYTATALAILFESVVLPGVYFPEGTLDRHDLEEQLSEIEARRAVGPPDAMDDLMSLGVRFVRDFQDLDGVFVGTGKRGHMGVLEPGAEDLTKSFEEAVYGPPPEGFTPAPVMGSNFPVLDNQINAPSWLSYPPNAYLYAEERGLPLVSDNQALPFPNRVVDPADVEKAAAQLAISSIATVLPKIRALNAEEISAARVNLRDDIEAFHHAMLRYVDDIRELLGSEPTEADITKEASYVARTMVVPALDELVSRIETPGSILKDEALASGLQDAPTIATQWVAHLSSAQLAALAVSLLGRRVYKGMKRHMASTELRKHSGLNLLLRLPEDYARMPSP